MGSQRGQSPLAIKKDRIFSIIKANMEFFRRLFDHGQGKRDLWGVLYSTGEVEDISILQTPRVFLVGQR